MIKKEQLEKLKEFYSKYRLFVYPIAIGLASLVLIIFVIFPQVKSFITDQSTLENTNERARALEVKAEELSNIDGDDLSRKLNLAVTALPTDKDYGSIIGLIQRIGVESGVAITGLTLSPTTSQKELGFTIKADVVGPRLTINNLIKNIETSPRVMKVNSIEISSAQASGDLTAALVINALYVPLPGSLGSVDSDLPKLSEKDQEILTTLTNSSLAQNIPTGPSTPSEPSEPTGPLLPRGKANPFQ